MILQFVAPDQLSEHRSRVEVGCKAVLAKAVRAGVSLPWNSTDVYRRLRRGLAQLFVVGNGFVVLERDSEPMSGDPFLRVWISFMPNEAKEKRAELIADLDAIKKAASCEWIQFESPFEGWAAIEPDFKKYMVTWRRK